MNVTIFFKRVVKPFICLSSVCLFLAMSPSLKATMTNQFGTGAALLTIKNSAGLMRVYFPYKRTYEVRIYTLVTQLNLSWSATPGNGWIGGGSGSVTNLIVNPSPFQSTLVAQMGLETLAKFNGTLEPEVTQTINIVVKKGALPYTPSDTDGDGILNANEAAAGTNPNNPDSDGDGLLDGEEVIQGTNPVSGDTDNDGVSDSQEVSQDSDPLDPSSSTPGSGNGGGGGGNNNNPLPPKKPYAILDLGAGRAFLLNDRGDAVLSSGTHPNDTYSTWRKGNLVPRSGIDIIDLNTNGDYLAIQYPNTDKTWGTFDANKVQTYIRNIDNGGMNQQLGDISGPEAPQFIQDEENYLSSSFDQSFDRVGLALNNNGEVFGTIGVSFDVDFEVPGDSEPTTMTYFCFIRVFWPQGGGSPQQVDYADHIDFGTYYGGYGWSGENWGLMGQMAGITDDKKMYANFFNSGGQNGSDGLLTWSSPGGSPSFIANKTGVSINKNEVILADNDPYFLSHNAVLCGSMSQTLGSGSAGSINNNRDAVGFNNNTPLYWKKNQNGGYENVQLSQLIDENSGWVLQKAFDINNSKMIAGSGSKGGSERGFLLVPVELGVDVNRDGLIVLTNEADLAVNQGKEVDGTSQDKPYRFWVNDDNDGLVFGAGDENPGGPPDCNDNHIMTTRDLEDFSRLWIYLKGMEDMVSGQGAIEVGLEWRDVTGSPSIQIYEAADTQNGKDDYLKQQAAANSQASPQYGTALGTVANGQPFTFQASFWNNLAQSQSKKFLLFEGVSKGKGKLVLIFKKNGQTIGEAAPLYMDLLNVKEMYDRAKAQPNSIDQPYDIINNPLPTYNFSWVSDYNGYPPVFPSDEEKKCVVFVHGWNMGYNDYISFSETMFKRLWWKGFKGRFCTFRWPTLTGNFTYNTSEHRAWEYGPALKQYVTSLPSDYAKNIAAHSMGNIVVGSALKAGMGVNNYALMQAAVPAGCYDSSPAINNLQRFVTAEATSPTPDLASLDLGYRGNLQNVNGNLVNFYNVDDFALATGFELGIEANWEANEEDYKPDHAFNNSWYYGYDPNAQAGQRGTLTYQNQLGRFVTLHHEMMSFVARPRSRAVGAESSVSGAIDSSINLKGAPYNFEDTRSEHSAQFNRNVQQLQEFYQTLGQQLGVILTP